MMSFIANAGAVPLGYISATADSEGHCNNSDGMCSQENGVMCLQHLRGVFVFPPLPDVVLSNTLPPPPFQRVISPPFMHPNSNNTVGSTNKGVVTLSRVYHESSGLETSPRWCHRRCHIHRWVREGSRQGVEQMGRNRVQTTSASRRQITGSDSLGSSDPNSHCLRDLHPNPSCPHLVLQDTSSRMFRCCCRLPGPTGQTQALTTMWPIIGNLHHQRRASMQRPTSMNHPREEIPENQNIYYMVGKDLRKIADHFQLDHGKVVKKSKQAPVLSLILPEAFTWCLSASVLLLVWWRILKKLN
ncbi:uncharacterized protein [Palaemon carinicauda]|uniref:uncharacterized protein n=1 Tax=Palaemon carinicauda TaxID=392227 RepID=UPI0035B5B597